MLATTKVLGDIVTYHGDLAGQGAAVYSEVEVEEDTAVCHGRVNNDPFAFLNLDSHTAVRVLLGEERTDVGLEKSGTHT